MFRRFDTVLLFALATLAVVPAQAVQRVFVASFGNDANTASNCGFTNPCRGFTAAMTVVDPGGEVVALDAAGYGAVTIAKSVTITANPGFYAGISASSGNAVTIATAAVIVTLRGLNINGIGATNGVVMSNGARLSVENCVISNFTSNGVMVSTAAKVRVIDSLVRDNQHGLQFSHGATAEIANTKVLGNSLYGIFVLADTASTVTTGTVTGSVASGNAYGILALATNATGTARVSVINTTASNNGTTGIQSEGDGGAALVHVGYSLVTTNAYGLAQVGGGVLETLGNNIVRANTTTNLYGTITPVSGQ